MIANDNGGIPICCGSILPFSWYNLIYSFVLVYGDEYKTKENTARRVIYMYKAKSCRINKSTIFLQCQPHLNDHNNHIHAHQ